MSTDLSPMALGAMEQPLAELDAMRRMLDASRGTFSLSIAVCNSRALREYLLRRLSDERPGIAIVSVPDGTIDPFGYVTSRLDLARPDALFVSDLECAIPSEGTEQKTLRSLNASRELWEKRFNCPVVFWLPEYAATLLSIHARDLWRYRSHRFDFTVDGVAGIDMTIDRLSGDGLAISNLSQDEKHFRIAELQQRLADASPDSALARHRLRWLGELGQLHFDLGRSGEAEDFWSNYYELAKELDSPLDLAAAYGNFALVCAAHGDARKAIAYYEQALVVFRETGNRHGEGRSLGNLGNTWANLGDARKAIGYYEQALIVAREIGDRHGEGNALGNLGMPWATLGDTPKAIGYYEQHLLIAREIGDRHGEGNALGNLGSTLTALGDARKAIGYHEQHLAIARKIGDRRGEGNALGSLGIAWAALGDARKAIGYYEQRLVIAREIGDRRGEANAIFNSAVGHNELGERAEARRQADQAAEIYAAIDSPHAEKARQLAAKLREKG